MSCSLPTALHVLSFVPSLLGLHRGANRGSMSFFLILSLFLSHQIENEYKFRPNGRNSPCASWLPNVRVGITVLRRV